MTAYELPKGLVQALATIRATDPDAFDEAAAEFAEEVRQGHEVALQARRKPKPPTPKAVPAQPVTVPKAAAEPAPTPRRTPTEMRHEIEQLLDTHARRFAQTHGLGFHAGYARFLGTVYGEELYRLYTELPPGPLPVPEEAPSQFAEPPETGAWLEVERLARKRVEAGECRDMAQATTKVLSEKPELYTRHLAAGGR